MANIGTLLVNLKARTGAFVGGMRKARRSMSLFQKSVLVTQRSLQVFGVALGAAGIYGIAAVMRKFVNAASDAQEQASKFKVVFGEQTDAARAWAENFREVVGRSVYDVEKYMAQAQDTFVPLGFARDQAAELSKAVVQLGVDLASFNNTADDAALQAMLSAIVGNHEAMRRYGVMITQSRLDQELLAKGFKKATQGATEQQKVMARMRLIFNDTRDAQGDAERTASSYANQVKRLKGNLHELAVNIGTELIPALNNLVTFVNDNWTSVLDAFRKMGLYVRIAIRGIGLASAKTMAMWYRLNFFKKNPEWEKLIKEWGRDIDAMGEALKIKLIGATTIPPRGGLSGLLGGAGGGMRAGDRTHGAGATFLNRFMNIAGLKGGQAAMDARRAQRVQDMQLDELRAIRRGFFNAAGSWSRGPRSPEPWVLAGKFGFVHVPFYAFPGPGLGG